MVRLTPTEAKVYELFKTCSTSREAANVSGQRISVITNRAKRLRELGLLKPIGGNQYLGYEYETTGLEYTVARKDTIVPSFEGDELLNKMGNFELSDKQMADYKKYKDLEPRWKLAARLGISKLHLNFCILKMEGEF